jgi:hypothetical protein
MFSLHRALHTHIWIYCALTLTERLLITPQWPGHGLEKKTRPLILWAKCMRDIMKGKGF